MKLIHLAIHLLFLLLLDWLWSQKNIQNMQMDTWDLTHPAQIQSRVSFNKTLCRRVLSRLRELKRLIACFQEVMWVFAYLWLEGHAWLPLSHITLLLRRPLCFPLRSTARFFKQIYSSRFNCAGDVIYHILCAEVGTWQEVDPNSQWWPIKDVWIQGGLQEGCTTSLSNLQLWRYTLISLSCA